MRHRKTTVLGVISALAMLVAGHDVAPPPYNIIARVVGCVALALLGHSAADRSKPGK